MITYGHHRSSPIDIGNEKNLEGKMELICETDNPVKLIKVDINEKGHKVETYERPDGSHYTVEYLGNN